MQIRASPCEAHRDPTEYFRIAPDGFPTACCCIQYLKRKIHQPWTAGKMTQELFQGKLHRPGGCGRHSSEPSVPVVEAGDVDFLPDSQ